MEIIKIKKSTIRKNPDYGMQGIPHLYPGATEVRVEHAGDLPQEILNKCMVISTSGLDGSIVRELIVLEDHENLIKYFSKTKKSSVTVTNEMIEVTCIDHVSKYYFAYHNPLVTCNECGKKVRFKDIESGFIFDTDGEEHNADKCPNCGEPNSFDYRLEKIEEALSNK